MTSTAPAGHGYSLGMAVRHLLTGPFRPRAALREGLASGLGERGRIVLFAGATTLYGLADPSARAAGENYVETVRQSTGPYVWALGLALVVALLGILVIVLYLGQSVVLHAVFRLGARSKPTFAVTRSVLALADWITVGLGCVLLLATRSLLPQVSIDAQSVESALLLAAIAPYLVLLISEATGSSRVRSAILLLLVFVGDAAISFGIDAGLEHLNAFLRSVSPEHEPV